MNRLPIQVLFFVLLGACAAKDPCKDGVRGNDETDVDCGGSCGTCHGGQACVLGTDCASGMCGGGRCIAIPSIRSISPANAPSTGGTRITLTGSDFIAQGEGGSLGVRVDGIPATEVRWVSYTEVTAVVPPRMFGSTEVRLRNPDGKEATHPFSYYYGTLRFTPLMPLGAGPKPYFIMTADANGDRQDDLLVVNEFDNSLGVFLGNGDGTFRSAGAYGTETYPLWMTVADFNGDGKLDMAAASHRGQSVNVLLGNGDGTFRPKEDLLTGETSPNSVAAADFNKDGAPDLVATYGREDQNLGLWLNLGDGKFAPPKKLTTTGAMAGGSIVGTGDFNGDGNPDIAASNDRSGNVSVLLGRGDGTFEKAVHYRVEGAAPYYLHIGDANADGRLDLCVANRSTNDVSVLLGKGDGTFEKARRSPAGEGTYAVTLADVNRDGLPDAVTVNYKMSDVSVLLGKGDGTFAAPMSLAAGIGPYGVTTGDFNGDGRPDIATANAGSNNLSLFLNESR